MTDLLQEPIKDGTASKALELKRPLAGKTEPRTILQMHGSWDLPPTLATGVWVGFDEKMTLGDKETGARAALPIWMDMMDRY